MLRDLLRYRHRNDSHAAMDEGKHVLVVKMDGGRYVTQKAHDDGATIDEKQEQAPGSTVKDKESEKSSETSPTSAPPSRPFGRLLAQSFTRTRLNEERAPRRRFTVALMGEQHQKQQEESPRRVTFATMTDAAAASHVDISQDYGDGVLLSGQESHVANLEEFDRYVQRLEQSPRSAQEDPFQKCFWTRVRSMLEQASKPIGFYSSEASSKVISVDRHQVDALAERIFHLQTTVSPLFPATFCGPTAQPQILTELLHATQVGLVTMMWSPKCSCCGGPLCSKSHLADLPATAVCKGCQIVENVNILDGVAVTFAFNKDVLPIPPEQTFLLVGNVTSPKFPSNILAARVLVPSNPSGSTVFRYSMTVLSTDVENKRGKKHQTQQNTRDSVLQEGRYLLRCFPQFKSFVLVVQRDATADDHPVTIQWNKESFLQSEDQEENLPEIVVPHGKLHLDFETDPRKTYLVMLYRQEKQGDLKDVVKRHRAAYCKAPFTSATDLLHHATFQRLYGSDQVVSANPDATLSIRHVVLVFTDIVGSTDMYATMGDGQALSMVRKHYEVLFGSFAQSGRVVKTVGDAVMASFTTGRAAMEAVASALVTLREECVYANGQPLRIRVGIHGGSTVVVPLNGINDYFGQTVNTAARVEASAGGDECFVTESVLESDEDAARAFQEILCNDGLERVSRRELRLKGIGQPVGVQGFRVK